MNPKEKMLELGKMEEINFVEKKAEEYVNRLGFEVAVEKLCTLAPKNEQASKILKIILEKHSPKKVENKQQNIQVITKEDIDPYVRRSQKPRPLTPKQKYTTLLEKLGLPFDTVCDSHWNPVVSVQWRNGKAEMNGREVVFPKKWQSFMQNRVLKHKCITFKMSIVRADDNKVVAIPDVNDFYAQLRNMIDRIKQEKQRKKDGFEVVVKRRWKNKVELECDSVEKNIIIPHRFLDKLKKNPGFWQFKAIDENRNRIIAKPERCLKPFYRNKNRRNNFSYNNRHLSKPFNASFGNNVYQYVTEQQVNERLCELYGTGSVML